MARMRTESSRQSDIMLLAKSATVGGVRRADAVRTVSRLWRGLPSHYPQLVTAVPSATTKVLCRTILIKTEGLPRYFKVDPQLTQQLQSYFHGEHHEIVF
jgi:hypothetical protein